MWHLRKIEGVLGFGGAPPVVQSGLF